MNAAGHNTQTNSLEIAGYATNHGAVATSTRDAAVREANKAGASFGDIATEGRLSHRPSSGPSSRLPDDHRLPRNYPQLRVVGTSPLNWLPPEYREGLPEPCRA